MKQLLLIFLSAFLFLSFQPAGSGAEGNYFLYTSYIQPDPATYLIDGRQRQLAQWPLSMREVLEKHNLQLQTGAPPNFVNLDAPIPAPLRLVVPDSLLPVLLDGQDPVPPFTETEFKQSQNRSREDQTQYKRFMRETVAEIEAGYMREAGAFLHKFLAKNPEDPEGWYAQTLWLVRRFRFAEAMEAMKTSIELGLPVERFLSGSPLLWQDFWDHAVFQDWLNEQSFNPFINGPLIGNLTANSMSIRLRVWGDKRPIIVVYQEPRNEFFLSKLFDGLADGDATVGNSYLVNITGLEPNTRYSYTLSFGRGELYGPFYFHTPLPAGEPARFTLAFGGGAGYTPWKERMWDTIRKQQPDMLLLLGDNVYIDHPERPATQLYCYARRQHRPEWQRLVRETPVYTIWDDHDFTYDDGRGGPEVETPYWKRDVWRLFQQQWANPAYGEGEDAPGCYYTFERGEVQFFMLDTRYYREDPAQSGASMLGERQLSWLKERLVRSEARFKVICSSVPMASGTKPGSLDTWDGHEGERQEIWDFLSEHQIGGVLILAADRHRSDLWRIERENDYPLYEMMSSRLTNVHVHPVMPASVFGYNELCSFGLLEFDTRRPDPRFTYRVVNIENDTVFERTFLLSELQ